MQGGSRKIVSITLFSTAMSNGCGCERGLLRYIKPPYAKRYYVPCVIHDDAYERGGDESARKEADITLFHNMQRVSRSHSRMPLTLVWFTLIALLYYASVRLFGRFYFTYHE